MTQYMAGSSCSRFYPGFPPFLSPKQHINKRSSSKSAWWSKPGTIWLSQTQLCLDTTSLIGRLALKVVQWPPFPFWGGGREGWKEGGGGGRREGRRVGANTGLLPYYQVSINAFFLGPYFPFCCLYLFIFSQWNLLTLATWWHKARCGKSHSHRALLGSS